MAVPGAAGLVLPASAAALVVVALPLAAAPLVATPPPAAAQYPITHGMGGVSKQNSRKPPSLALRSHVRIIGCLTCRLSAMKARTIVTTLYVIAITPTRPMKDSVYLAHTHDFRRDILVAVVSHRSY